MFEVIPFLFVYALALLLPVALIVFVIVAFMRTARIGELSARVDRLEAVVRRQRQSMRQAKPAEIEAEAVLQIKPEQPPPEPQRRPAGSEHFEAWIGRRALGWVAVG